MTLLDVRLQRDPGRSGFPPGHPYLLDVYPSVVGPSAAVLLVHLLRLGAAGDGRGTTIDVTVLADLVGVRPSRLRGNAVARLSQAGLVRVEPPAPSSTTRLVVPIPVPPVAEHRAARLTPAAMALHRLHVAATGQSGSGR